MKASTERVSHLDAGLSDLELATDENGKWIDFHRLDLLTPLMHEGGEPHEYVADVSDRLPSFGRIPGEQERATAQAKQHTFEALGRGGKDRSRGVSGCPPVGVRKPDVRENGTTG